MGSAFSKAKSSQDAAVAEQGPEEIVPPEEGSLTKQHGKDAANALSAGNEVGGLEDEEKEISYDLDMIVKAGLHEDTTADSGVVSSVGSHIKKSGQTIQDAVEELKKKFSINAPIEPDSELSKIRNEIDAYGDKKVPVRKGKGRADSISSDESEDSSSDESDSSDASSSSGSSLGFGPRKVQKRKQPGEDEAEDASSDDYDDEDDMPKPSKKANLSAAVSANTFFASPNEIVDPKIEVSEISVLPEDAPMRACGSIDSIIDTVIVVRADVQTDETSSNSGLKEHQQVLDEGSLLCLADRKVLGPIFETFGAVSKPLYSIRLPPSHPFLVGSTSTTLKVSSHEEMSEQYDGAAQAEPTDSERVQTAETVTALEDSSSTVNVPIAKLTVGTRVYFSPKPDFSRLLFTRDIRAAQKKGSDASNLYDEEPGEAEVEFSDDEQELEFKRMLKQKKRDRIAERLRAEYQTHYNGSDEFQFDEEDGLGDRPEAAGMEEEEGEASEILTQASVEDNKSNVGTDAATLSSKGSPRSPAKGLPRSVDLHRGTNKQDQSKSARGGQSGRGNNRARGRGGRGASNSGSTSFRNKPYDINNAPNRSRGNATDRGRGRGNSRGSRGGRGAHVESPSHFHQRPPTSQQSGLPNRPPYQHPDALPYDSPTFLPQTLSPSSTASLPRNVPPRGSPTGLSQQTSVRNDLHSGSMAYNPQAWSPASSFMAGGYNPLYSSGVWNPYPQQNFATPMTGTPYPNQNTYNTTNDTGRSNESHNPHYQATPQYSLPGPLQASGQYQGASSFQPGQSQYIPNRGRGRGRYNRTFDARNYTVQRSE